MIGAFQAGVMSQRLWTPTRIATSLWLDAADSSTITIETGVSAWADKSGNGYHAVQTNEARRPVYVNVGINGNSCILFNGSSQGMRLNAPFVFSSDYTLFLVFRPTNTITSGTGLMQLLGYHEGGNETFVLGLGALTENMANEVVFDVYNYSNSYGYGSSTNISGVNIVANGWNGSSYVLSINGSNNFNLTSSAGGYLSTRRPVRFFDIGYRGDNNLLFFYGDIAEILVYPGSVAATVYKIQGYLAHKWGSASTLPTNHPYKSVAPYA